MTWKMSCFGACRLCIWQSRAKSLSEQSGPEANEVDEARPTTMMTKKKRSSPERLVGPPCLDDPTTSPLPQLQDVSSPEAQFIYSNWALSWTWNEFHFSPDSKPWHRSTSSATSQIHTLNFPSSQSPSSSRWPSDEWMNESGTKSYSYQNEIFY